MKNKLVNIIFWLLVAATGCVGALCLVYSRIPEGCIILGAVVILVFMFFVLMRKDFKASSKAVHKAAGNVLTQISGSCRIDGGAGSNNTLQLCDNGVCLCDEFDNAKFIKYEDIELQDSGSVHHVQFDIKGVGVCRFVCESTIKVKAITQALQLKKG